MYLFLGKNLMHFSKIILKIPMLLLQVSGVCLKKTLSTNKKIYKIRPFI